MEIKEDSQKKILLSVLGVAILVVAVVGISFAAFSLTKTSTTNTLSTGTLMVSYSEDSQEINITDALPMSDEDALNAANLKEANESFAFTVSTTANDAVTIPYSISLTPVAADNTLLNSEIKVYLTKGGTAVAETSTPKLVSALSSYTGHSRTGSFLLHSDSDVYSDSTGGTTQSEYLLKMWIDSATELDMNVAEGKVFKAKVNVDSDVDPLS